LYICTDYILCTIKQIIYNTIRIRILALTVWEFCQTVRLDSILYWLPFYYFDFWCTYNWRSDELDRCEKCTSECIKVLVIQLLFVLYSLVVIFFLRVYMTIDGTLIKKNRCQLRYFFSSKRQQYLHIVFLK